MEEINKEVCKLKRLKLMLERRNHELDYDDNRDDLYFLCRMETMSLTTAATSFSFQTSSLVAQSTDQVSKLKTIFGPDLMIGVLVFLSYSPKYVVELNEEVLPQANTSSGVLTTAT